MLRLPVLACDAPCKCSRWEAGWGLEPALTCLPASLQDLGLLGIRQGKFSVRAMTRRG